MGLFNPGSGTGDARAKAQRLDTLLGILGFFTFMAAVQTVVLEVRGEAAGGSAALLAVLLLACWLVWRARRNTGA
ncbi:hypothetical protein RKE38_15945 [Phycicoccus sp. M110.8]|uniref:hypothetical protein n=1 Tax=Intrasporangiaceae TaxID=85021 RepID=UPI0028FD2440|nr:hypothetical protein [Phycicoccus sp. M110.8]MDU0315191.1 hypothetical protein [Phycicoccus sp. M110.8]HET8768455.1 hypothetical protein [Pedococcus sp.]